MAAGPWLARRRRYPHGQQDAGAHRGDQAARTTPGSAAILAAGPWPARQRLHPIHPSRPPGCSRSQGRSGSTHNSRERRHHGGRTLTCKTASPFQPPLTASRMRALQGAIRQHARLPGAPPSWLQDLDLQDSVSIPTTPHSQQDAGAPRGDQAAHTTPGSDAILAAGTWLARQRLHSIHPSRPAGCSRSQGRSGSTHNSRERRHLGGRTLACKTASPSQPTLTASRMLALPGTIRQHARLPGAPPSWRQELGLQDSVSTPTTPTASRMLALPGAIRQHTQLPGAPPSWRQVLGLLDGVSIPTTPTASRMLALPGAISQHTQLPGAPPSWRQDLGLLDGGSTPHGQQDAGAPRGDQAANTTHGSDAILAAGTWLARRRLHPHHTSHGQQDAGAPNWLLVTRVLSNHWTCALRRTGKVRSPAA